MISFLLFILFLKQCQSNFIYYYLSCLVTLSFSETIHRLFIHINLLKYKHLFKMNQLPNRKSIMRLLGIQQLITQYENHCDRFNNKNKSSIPRDRYMSLSNHQQDQNKKKNSNTGNAENTICDSNVKMRKYRKVFNQSSKNQEIINSYTDKGKHYQNLNKFQSKKHPVQSKKNTIDIKSCITQSKNCINQQKMNKFSSSINFSKKGLRQSNKKVSIHQGSHLKLHPNRQINSEINSKSQLINNNQKINASMKGINFRNTQKSRQAIQCQIDLQNSTLSTINKKLKQFDKNKNKQSEKGRLSQKVAKHDVSDNFLQGRVNSVRVSDTIQSMKQENISIQKQFVSFDTNYYGFSFKNKLPIKFQKQDENKDISSTIDKTMPENQPSKQSQKKFNKNYNSVYKMKKSIDNKVYETVQVQKKNYRYPSNVMNKKKIHSSLFLKPKLFLKDRYELMKVIGRGMSGQVYQAKDVLSDRYVAIKQININSVEYDFFREISHQNIIKYYNNFVQNQKRYLVLEYFPMTLKDLLKDTKNKIVLTEQNLKNILKGILNGLSYLHSLSIAHRDIKLDNIVISSDLQEVRFIDFGLCMDLSKCQQGLSKQFCGTLSYLPPEIIKAQAHQPKKADIWSLGIVIYGLSVGRLPYKGKNENEILSKICKNKLVYPDGFQTDLRQLIQGMLQKNPAKRFTIHQILGHKWMH